MALNSCSSTISGHDIAVRGSLRCPVAAVVGPLEGLDFWVQPGLDMHLLLYRQSLSAVQRLAGRERAQPVRALVGTQFLPPPTREDARRRLEIEQHELLVVVSGGGWGAGDVCGATDAALAAQPRVRVVVVAGRNERLMQALRQRHSADARVTVLGFTDQMATLLSAADAFVTSTAGTSCIEALLYGCPIVSYGFHVGHVRDNLRALAAQRLARAAATQPQLEAALREAFTCPRPERLVQDDLPHAAEVVIGLAAGAWDDRPSAARAGDARVTPLRVPRSVSR
jgi:processive 1,2-diacylglycerol beta-glucosyltransferase